jgi:ABC-type branched-subunit amino acid transport system substrate-binding protein
MSRRLRPAIALVAVLAAGCGTTVSSGTTAAGSTNGNTSGLSATGSGANGSGPGAAAGGGTGAALSNGSNPNSGPAAGAGAEGSGSLISPGAPGTLPAAGRGYDAHHLFLGFPTNNDVNTAAPSGVGATNFGDQPTIIKTVVDDINRHGGVLGRTVVPVFHDIATASLETDATAAAQATCTAFTQDSHVVAVVNIVAAIDLPAFYSCLAKADTPLISAGFIPADDKFFNTYAPYLYKLTAASFTRLTPVWLTQLASMGYFHGWDTTNGAASSAPTKVGLLYPAQQPQQRIFADIKQRLTHLGYPVFDYQYDATSLNNESASMNNAVLQMRNNGVTHILSSESDVLLFMTAADSQHYRPRYGLTSYHAPAVQLQGTVPTTQLVGSMGVGWLPVSDVDAAHNPGPVSAGETSCRALMQRAGQDTSRASVAVVAFAICDGVRLIAAAINDTGTPTTAGLHEGLAQASSGFTSAITWGAGIGGRRFDLPAVVRDFAFNGSAYAYVSKAEHSL